ncbi:MAG: peptidase S10 [Chthoniobacteraceae bacterium]
MRLFLSFSFSIFISFCVAQEKPADPAKDAKPAEQKPDDKPAEEKPKDSKGSATIGGFEVKYLARTGTLPLLKEDGSGERARVFYVYYAALGEDGQPLATNAAAKRPITYCFNGGPGAASVWLHFGGLGPKKVELSPDGLQPTPRGAVVPNPNSILDVTDLVFIDPVGTGASRPSKGEKGEQFWSVKQDIESVGEFIRLFTTREQRWASPKYLCGESYGGIRGSGLASFLQSKHGLYLDGFISVSGVVNFETLRGDFVSYTVFLPAFTATAHYHKKLAPDLQADREKAIAAARDFAQGDYARALLVGDTLPAADRSKAIDQLARFTGLDRELIDRARLRISPSLFFENLLRKEGKIIGRFDARVTAEDYDRLKPGPEFDPSYTNVYGPFAAAANASIRGDLGYELDLPYKISGGVNWSWNEFAGEYVNLEDDLGDAMKGNTRLRVLFCCAWRDLAVPPDSALFSIAHLPIPDSLRKNIAVEYYESGHMMYLYQPDAEKLRRDIVKFIGQP